MEEKGKNKISLLTIILGLIFMALVCVILVCCIIKIGQDAKINEENAKISSKPATTDVVSKVDTKKEENNSKIKDIPEVESLNFEFLKMENTKENKVYSPLSIKYALKMLEEGAMGEAKEQVSRLISKYNVKKYDSNENMALANAFIVKDGLEVKQDYINTLKNKYNAEIKFDEFKSPKNVNEWISGKTLNLINDMINEIPEDTQFLLINALGIDMNWNQKFLDNLKEGGIDYKHEKFSWYPADNVISGKFDNEKQEVSGMEIIASVNNYDIVKELGEEKIKKTVGDEYRKYLKETTDEWFIDEYLNGNKTDENIEKEIERYLKQYITDIDANYKREDKSTEFSLYVDKDVKVFAKDLEESNGTTLQYVGIMPTTVDLETYIKSINENKINTIIKNLKEIKAENFKNGVVTKITGFIPKFKFEYELNLKKDLEALNVKDVFEMGKANLKNMCDSEDLYVEDALHQANIEFTQDGIKAAAATMIGGAGAGEDFNYFYDVPVEEIDLTFNNPYMFIIRDKDSGEIWFTGTVYEPLAWENEPENNQQ